MVPTQMHDQASVWNASTALSTQATIWLKAHLAAQPGVTVVCTEAHDPCFVSTLELAVRFGKTLLVTEIDNIEPIFYPLLRRDLQLQGSRQVGANDLL